MSPEGERCATARQDATVFTVEKTWEISGVAANWKMTVAILEPDCVEPDLAPPPGPPEPSPDFEGLVEHFRTLVGMAEAQWQLDQLG